MISRVFGRWSATLTALLRNPSPYRTFPVDEIFVPVIPGSFGSPAGSGVQCGLAVFGEVFESFDELAAGASDDGEHGVAQGGQNLGRRAGAGAALVLAAGDVANVMQPILDAPVVAREGQQAGGVGLLSG